MENLLHKKDRFGNDLYFRDAGEVLLPPFNNCPEASEQLQRVRDLELHPDDVIVAGFPKSGNNWTHHMVSLLQGGVTQLPPVFGTDNFVYLEGIGKDVQIPSSANPRAVFTHLPFHLLPRDVLKKKVKVIYVTRNPKDVSVSYYSHLKNLGPPMQYDGTWEQFFSHFFGEGFWYGNVFDHLMDWQKQIDAHPDHPIFHCSFEDSKKDTLAQVEKLNQFLGTDRSRELCKAIADSCQFANIHVTRPVDEDVRRNKFLWKEGVSVTAFYRKGAVGDWKNWYTVAQNEQFDDVYTAKMAHYRGSFVFE